VSEGVGEISAVLAIERPHQRRALDAEQVRKRVLIDHEAMLRIAIGCGPANNR
jgi:hypothetical protein